MTSVILHKPHPCSGVANLGRRALIDYPDNQARGNSWLRAPNTAGQRGFKTRRTPMSRVPNRC